ncbi:MULTISPECIES: SDR family NAD(P)-dependent oxidoreductase [Mycolicibacterium]|uniref:SDR family NAD(P)-dependent oxidoreductase n=1 Tax=Mycolicibacterium TaxID=1866885 RepID=UPI00093BB1C7|nr:SDR family oxidoreductase [Mycolicibacterium mageritense]OKH83683.1 3-oxoacyl-ACP reductase [Mycobacterium sp. SWH-M3]TXI56371.1 MAG: SDR family oxidoreductase [Mycolicibacterium mageritense]GJJ21197.1 3-oxoacyl-ACP reductase [Mycolicibacterium mageritense]
MTARSTTLTYGGTNAVVTGAASGIGAATVDLLVQAGIRTLALDLRDDRSPGADPLTVREAVDVRDRAAVRAALHRAFPDGRLSYLVNCAGIPAHTGFRGVGVDQWRSVLEVNLVGAYNVIDASTDLLAASDPAAVVNITSMEASRVIALTNPDPNPHYAASKAALAMLTRTAARALGPRVRVNSIAPGFVATPMAAEHGDTSTLPSQLAARTVAGRWAQPAEIASAVGFLLSDQAAYLTGSELCVDGGLALT